MGRICVLADSGKYLPSGSERDPHVLQILIGQMGEFGYVNLILGKTLGVLPETELFEPVRNLLHRGHQADFSSLALLDRRHPELILPVARLQGAFCRA